jgi:hypothetical protein
MDGKKVSELKKMLREIRMKECPPISKMKKAQVVDEIARVQKGFEEKKEVVRDKSMKQLREVEAQSKSRNMERKKESALKVAKQIEEEVAKKAPKEKKVVKSMVVALDEKIKSKKEEPAMRIRVPGKKDDASVSDVEDGKKKKMVKGSEEAKEYMAKMRGMRGKKD